eukprot:CAMPEP_0115342892 /NCGR_PEP_ID=MMETSP0270-20121206/92447_1 /TAXON_ID=71861 /ORGANISM="Scrippsiella trochoidea, Strain CCMP3099" /LENGTH=298 /DNA_ID=CAMNT_0002764493 /DNA_START=58 /DNA_END=952 /DNA_ORIENTATION=+
MTAFLAVKYKVGSSSSGFSQDGSQDHHDGIPGKFPHRIRQHLANIDFRDNSSSTISASEKASGTGSALGSLPFPEPTTAQPAAQFNGAGARAVEDALRNRLRDAADEGQTKERRMKGKKAKTHQADDAGLQKKSHASSSSDPAFSSPPISTPMTPDVEVSEEDQREFEKILANAGFGPKVAHSTPQASAGHAITCIAAWAAQMAMNVSSAISPTPTKTDSALECPSGCIARASQPLLRRRAGSILRSSHRSCARRHLEVHICIVSQIVRASSSRSSYLHSILKERLDNWTEGNTGTLS